MRILLALVVVLVPGCWPMGEVHSAPVDITGKGGRHENRPPDVEGAVGEAGTPADWSTVPSC